MNKLLEKVIAIVLVTILAGANLVMLSTSVYALTDSQLAGQSTTTQNANVEFNAYFEEGGHIKRETTDSKGKLYLNIKVKNAGYLKNGVVTFENANFKIDNGLKSDLVQSFSIENNQIILNQINNNSDVTIEVPITMTSEEIVDINHFSKETTSKFTGIYVDAGGKEKNISKSIINKLSWNGTAKVNVKAELTKYIPYAIDGKTGVMIQTKVNANVVDNKLPIKDTGIEINAPELNGVKPTSATVIANNTKATNGQENGVNFVNDNANYEANTGKLKINVQNPGNEENKIAWSKNAEDEYIVTFMYEGQESYNYANENGLNANMPVNVKMDLYNDVDTQIKKSITAELKAEQKLGKITDFDVYLTEQIGKGQIYANYVADKKVEVPYNVVYNSKITNKDLVENITFEQGVDTFLTKENEKAPTTVSGNNYVYNKNVKISQAVFNKMLGEDGSVEVSTVDGVQIGIINKETIENKTVKTENGNYVLVLSEVNNNKLIIKTTKPITEGEIVLTVEKAIKGQIDYSKEQMKTFTKLETELTGKAGKEAVSTTKQMQMNEVKSVASIEVSKKDLTTVVKNENVEIRGVLDTSSINNALYKNPTLKIKLPSYINKVELKDYKVLMDENLKIKGTPEITKENGAFVINVVLEGTQKAYSINAEYKGAIVRLTTDLTVETLAPSNKNKITMTFTNANEVSTNKTGEAETELNFVAPTGVVAANEMSNYAKGKADVMSISEDTKTVEIATHSEKRIVTVSGTVVNNYSNKIGNVVVLGRFPAKDSKKIDTDTALDSTFNTTLKNIIKVTGIDASKYIVYYSENGEATADLSNTSNRWTTTATTGAKSYMIVTKDYEMAAGDTIKFSYDTELPEDLAHNNKVEQMYKVYYNNMSNIGKMAESRVSAVMALTTGQGPEFAAEVTSTEQTVREGQIVKMQATVKNTGNVTAEDVNLNVVLPKYMKLVEFTTSEFRENKNTRINIGRMKAGETKVVSYYLKVDDDTVITGSLEGKTPEEIEEIVESQKFPKEITNKVEITASNLTGSIQSNEYKMQVQDGKMKLELIANILGEQVLKRDDVINYTLFITNIDYDGGLNNAIVSIPLPNGVEYQEAHIKQSVVDETGSDDGITFSKNTNTIQVVFNKLETESVIEFSVKVGDISNGFSINAMAKADNAEEHYSNTLSYSAEKIELSVSELTSTPRYVKETNNITYKVGITNNGKAIATGVELKDQLPEGVELVKASYIRAEEEVAVTTTEDNLLEVLIGQIGAGETIEISIIVKANMLPNQNDKEVKNQVSVSADSFTEIKTNVVTNIIEYYAGAHTDDETEGPSVNGRYKITGTAWADSNKNGKREADETLLENITVMLLNKADNSIVKDTDSNQPKQTKTNNNGKYEFTNLPEGEYLVVFIYDGSRYSITTYQAQGVDTSLNSDAIDTNITYEGERRVAGITDVLSITDSNIRDIDIGLYSAEKFDLRLDKYVSKITLTTPTIGTRTDDYKNAKTGKVEILGKNAGKSNIVIEYRLVVKNEGAVPGYARKIVDYIPDDVKFSTDLNKDWYLSDNGNVYNSSLANEKINPGESKEVTLVVTKKITESSIGSVINNNAEIYEAYNELGLKDIDSTPGNKAEAEDDISKADVVISLVTGKIILYTTLTIVIVAVIGFSAYVIKKRVLNKKEN